MLENSDLRFQVLKDSVDRGGSAVHQRVIGVLVTNNIVVCLSRTALLPHKSVSLTHSYYDATVAYVCLSLTTNTT